MGISDLWEILASVKHVKGLKDFRGKTLAIDFSAWFVECNNNPHANRSIFYRVLHFMKNGITPVFTADSLEAPEIKKRKRGDSFFNEILKWEQLLTAMGFKFIRSAGEAEKTCAQLDRLKAVDGCVTNDGDTFAYGATCVLKGYKAQSDEIHVYEMAQMIEELGLGRKELIAAALLVGSDYNSGGVAHVGQKKFMDLIHELKTNEVGDIIERMRSWQTNDALKSLKEEMDNLEHVKRETHCSECHHLGSVSKHEKRGCPVCVMDEGCHKWTDDSESVAVCPCHRHSSERSFKPFLTELKVRESALKEPGFPDEKVIAEFLSEDENIKEDIDVTARSPNYRQVIKMLTESFGVGHDDAKNFFPALIEMSLYGQAPHVTVVPLKVLKKCIKDREACYLVKFQKHESDWTCNTGDDGEDGYEIKILQTVFDSKFPQMSPKKDSDSSETKKGTKQNRRKRVHEDKTQRKLTDMFAVKKKTPIKCDTKTV